ncbi:MAG: creatininase family protein [Chloroflexota bacterium]
MAARLPYRYSDLTWPEIKEAIAAQKVVILPVGTVEDHGRHLPLDTDNFLVTAVCEEAASRAPESCLVMPTVPYGFNEHHIDFPGTIAIDVNHMLDYCLDITKSVAYHGFKKILVVSGHGSNTSPCDLIARQTVLRTNALCASFMYKVLGHEVEAKVIETPASHACEWETSLYLHIAGDRVQMDKAVREFPPIKSEFMFRGNRKVAPVTLMEWWSTFTESGVVGDPTLATADKGKQVFEAIVDGMVRLVHEFRERPIVPRRDKH